MVVPESGFIPTPVKRINEKNQTNESWQRSNDLPWWPIKVLFQGFQRIYRKGFKK